jgi:hypothetical protein
MYRAVQHRAFARRCRLRSRTIVRDSAWLIRRSRLLLDYPSVGPICGGSDLSEAIRERVREGLLSGALPPVDGNRSWAGRGTGRTCRICAEPIGPDQIEHEVEAPDSVLVHQACLIIWREESARPR